MALKETRKAIADYENTSGVGNSFVTALPQNSKVQLGALALAPDHTQLQQMTKVRLASLKAGMSSRLTEQVLALLKTQPAAVDEGEYNIKVESSSSLSFMFKAKFAGKGGSTDTTYDDKASLHLVVQGRHSQEIEDDIVTTVLLPLYSANLNCRALAALLPEGTTKCYAYLINRVYSCKEIFIDMSHASAVNVGADVNVDPVDVAAKVGWQKSASAQVLHDRNGELFPYGFTYLKVKMEKMITKLSRKEPALLAADAAARIAELLPTIKAAEQKKQEVMDALAVSRAASSQPPVFGAGGAGLAVKQGRVTRVKARKVALRAHKEPKEYWRLSLA